MPQGATDAFKHGLARLADLANHGADHPEEAEKRALLDLMTPDLAAIEVVTPPEPKEVLAVLVIANEEARRAAPN